MRFAIVAVVALGAALSACTPDNVTSFEPPAAVPAFAESSLLPCDDAKAGTGDRVISGLTKPWHCWAVIQIGGPADRASAIQTAIARWTAATENPAVAGFPRVRYTAGVGDVQVIVVGSGSLWCGGTPSPPVTVTMTTNCPNYKADFTTVLTHELAHVFGYDESLESADTVPDHCALHLPSSGSPCQEEIEYLYAGYGFRDPASASDLWWLKIVTGILGVPATLTLQEGQTYALSPTEFYLGRQPEVTEPLGGAPIDWTSDDHSIAVATSGPGVITAVQAGTTIIRGRPYGLPAGLTLGSIMAAVGQPIAVTVTPAPPPGGGFRVTSIDGITPPVKVAGTYYLSASVANKPAGSLQIAWKVVYSTAPQDTLRTSFGANSYALNVPAGSYSIRVYATPRSGSGNSWTVGADAAQDFPVCTGGGGGGGGGEFVAAQGGGDTDAVGGC